MCTFQLESTKYYYVSESRPFPSGWVLLVWFGKFHTCMEGWNIDCQCHIMRILWQLIPSSGFSASSGFTLALISLSTLILASFSSHFLIWVSLAAVKPKEDGGHNEVDKIKDKDASRAGNERGYRIFFFHSPLSLSPQNSPSSIWKGFPYHTCDMFSSSMNIMELRPDVNKSLTAISC